MTNQEILQLAHSEAPELMNKTASMLAELETDHSTFAEQAMVDFKFILDRANTGLEKNANISDVLKKGVDFLKSESVRKVVGTGAKAVGIAVGAGLGVAIATDLYDAARRGLSKGGNLKRILEANPDLKKQVRTEKELYTTFDTIHRFAPELTADPMLGGAMMMNMISLPIESRTKFVQDLINSRNQVINAKKNQLDVSVLNALPYLVAKPQKPK